MYHNNKHSTGALFQVPTRHTASTGMYLLTFRVTTPTRCMDEMEQRTARNSRVDFIAGEGSSPACVVRGTVYGGPGGLWLGSATHF